MEPNLSANFAANFSDLQLRQLDAALDRWRSADLPARPPSGWLKAIRQALGMTATHLARRLGVTTSTLTRLEISEADDTISLATLRRAAEALGCELHYALVPRQPLTATLEERASRLAQHQMAAISHSMALEAQSTSREHLEAQTRALAESLLKGSRRALWKERGQ
ncbi:MAG: mobile mystery protein A [Candidatus Accumulibacter sp.]|uniref:Mobile mystery protein A n=1 Tax=Candidatus Accumulibacter proximus TaxID=2954385 RepID=A0A935PY87_9PROT|nr:mobile mystery protein A [Candidatus Accumulibacter proximus]